MVWNCLARLDDPNCSFTRNVSKALLRRFFLLNIMEPVVIFVLSLAALTAAQGSTLGTIFSVLSAHSELTNITSYLGRLPVLFSQIEAGNVTGMSMTMFSYREPELC